MFLVDPYSAIEDISVDMGEDCTSVTVSYKRVQNYIYSCEDPTVQCLDLQPLYIVSFSHSGYICGSCNTPCCVVLISVATPTNSLIFLIWQVEAYQKLYSFHDRPVVLMFVIYFIHPKHYMNIFMIAARKKAMIIFVIFQLSIINNHYCLAFHNDFTHNLNRRCSLLTRKTGLQIGRTKATLRIRNGITAWK